MRISFQKLGKMIKDTCGLSIPTVTRLVRRHWCVPMVVKGYCTQDCNHCAAHLRFAFQLEGAGNPAALLVRKLRDEVASVPEKDGQHEFTPMEDAF